MESCRAYCQYKYLIRCLVTVASIFATFCPADSQDLRPPKPVPVKGGSVDNGVDQGPVDLSAGAGPKTLKHQIDEAEASHSIFIDPDKVIVQPPVLKALIKLDKVMNPLHLDAFKSRSISLGDVLKSALSNNLAIKISRSDKDTANWTLWSSAGKFLPDLTNVIGFQGITGSFASPAGLALAIRNPFFTSGDTFTYYLFRGGGIWHGFKQAKHTYRASQSALHGTTNDVLLKAARLYYDLVLNDALLQIRVKALEEADAILQLNSDLFEEGVATRLDVLQSKTQQSKYRQALIVQQIARRQSAINLSTALYQDTGIDLDVRDRTVSKIRLIPKETTINKLLQIALESRPELRQFEEQRLAAKAAVKVARAKLLPQVAATGGIVGTGSRVVRQGSDVQQVPLNASGGGSIIGPITSAGGIPLAGGNQGPKHWTTRALYQLGVDVTWELGGASLVDGALVKAQKYQARKAQLELNNAVENVYREVRNSYLDTIETDNLVVETTNQVKSAEEELRIATLRLREGVGTQTDVIIAQRDYTQALVRKAEALIKFNVAQAQLMHDLGIISFNTLTRGMRE